MRKLLSVKGIPDQILPTLRAIEKYENLAYPENNRRIKQELAKELPKYSRSKHPDVDNLISAQAIPTCERLGLITKDKRHRRLKFYGRKISRKVGRKATLLNEEAKIVLAKAIVEIDKKDNCKIIDAIKKTQNAPGDAVSFKELIETLRTLGVDASIGSRLSDLLQYYDAVGIVSYGKGKVTLFQSRLNEVMKGDVGKTAEEISDLKFVQSLHTHYKELVRETKGSPYVPIIPRLRERVCDDCDLGETNFRNKLLSLPSIIFGKQILLSPPMQVKPKHQVIKKGKTFLYYISMYEVKENVQ